MLPSHDLWMLTGLQKAISMGEDTIRQWQENNIKFIIFNYKERFELDKFQKFTNLLAKHRNESLPRIVAYDDTFHHYTFICKHKVTRALYLETISHNVLLYLQSTF